MGRDAVVIGGGLAGMLAAHALRGHARKVVVIERDRYPAEPAFRKGVPQARHLHIFLSGGQNALETLLPGTGAALTGAGAHRLHMPRDLLTCLPNGWQRRYHEARNSILSCTRPLLDSVVRAGVLAAADDRLEVVQGAEVVGLLGTTDRVTGVRVRSRGGDRAEYDLPAALVVDASGRGSRAGEWLAALGRPAPRLEVVDAGLAYATRVFRPSTPPPAAVYVQARPGTPRGGVYVPVENGDWLMTLFGVRGHHPPHEPDDFLAFAGTLAHPYLRDLAKDARALSPIHGFRDTANRRRHYDAPGGVPDGFLAIADAACTVNPIYGQGMSVACLGALALRGVLAGGDDALDRPGLAGTAQRAVSAAAETAWMTASGADRPYASTTPAEQGFAQRAKRWYLARLSAHAAMNRVVGSAYRDLLCLTAPPTRLLHPAVALRTLLLPPRPGHAEPPLETERL
jgi:2-polyprenyl-6-methoxyphenol hydroxylase-like FAD-dependent oxidoreductase